MKYGLEASNLNVLKMDNAGGSLTTLQRSVKEGRQLGRSASHSSNPTMHIFLKLPKEVD